jgi:nitrous oxidase accessory protein
VLAPALACLALGLGGAAAAGETAARPAGCRDVPPGADLQALIDAAAEGEALCLAPGRYAGPLRIGHRVVLWAPPEAILYSSGEGTTLRIEGDRAALLGLTIDGSGARFDLLDAALHVQAREVRVEGVTIRNAVFGILVERSERVVLRGNQVIGDPTQTLGLRGDSIRLWETRDSVVEENLVRDGRDVVVWYSPRNRIARNTVERSRYGTHLMYSSDVAIEGNRFLGNVTGVFVMYSRGVELRDNVVADSAGAAGIGLGAKESGNLRVVGNQFLHNTVGIYLDTSPLYPEDRNLFEDNSFRFGEVGVVFHSSEERNSFRGNRFADNQDPVRVEGGGDALGVEWRGNAFDDYAGYDLDGDGIGDVAYELRSLSSELIGEVPALAFFRGTQALALAEAIGRIVPIFEPKLLLVDPTPRVAQR